MIGTHVHAVHWIHEYTPHPTACAAAIGGMQQHWITHLFAGPMGGSSSGVRGGERFSVIHHAFGGGGGGGLARSIFCATAAAPASIALRAPTSSARMCTQ